MIAKIICYVLVLEAVVGQVVYDAYFGKPLTDSRRNALTQANATGVCTVAVEPCKKEEGRRVDGTCANPRYPSRGGSPTPLLRMLPSTFGLGNSFRPAKNGSDLPSTRIIRTKILTEGYIEDHQFSTLLTHVFVFSFVDHIDLLYMVRYSVESDCCLRNTPNRVNPMCISIPVPQDDPTLRRTGIRCMNLTRFETYQEKGCIPNTLPAERFSRVTPLLDLSLIYGNTVERNKAIRANQGGDNFSASLLSGTYLTAMWFFREHNRLARNLAKINPCWTDEQLFQSARQINIAQWQYILYYEIIAALLGKDNAMKAGILYDTVGYVNDFDDRLKPGVYHEYVTASRWFHTLQDGRTDLYSNKGKYLGTRTTVDDALRSGILEVNNTEADITQGTFRQPAGKIDWNLDYDIAERIFGEYQSASDVVAIDMQRGRDAGLPPYNEYRKICGLPQAHDWEDFEDTIWPDKVEQLRRLYEDVDDVDLMAAIYSEKLLPGSWVGPTLFCIMTRNLVEMRRADRHFFEHGDIPAALTLAQLNEVRKTSIARLLCDNGDKVDSIQPQAVYIAGKGNEIVSCNLIPGIDLNRWEDPVCDPARDKPENKVEDKSNVTRMFGLTTWLFPIPKDDMKKENNSDKTTTAGLYPYNILNPWSEFYWGKK